MFVHGFDTDMAWSAKHMGVYAYKMRGRMPFFLYEWPSFEVRASVPELAQCITRLCAKGNSLGLNHFMLPVLISLCLYTLRWPASAFWSAVF